MILNLPWDYVSKALSLGPNSETLGEVRILQIPLKTAGAMNQWVTHTLVWTSLKYFTGSICTDKAVWFYKMGFFFLIKKKKQKMAELGLKEVNIFPKTTWKIQKWNPDYWVCTWLIFQPPYTYWALRTSRVMGTDVTKHLSSFPRPHHHPYHQHHHARAGQGDWEAGYVLKIWLSDARSLLSTEPTKCSYVCPTCWWRQQNVILVCKKAFMFHFC